MSTWLNTKDVCQLFEDNRNCIEIITNHKTRARTKHLPVRLHHFHTHVVNKMITINHIQMEHLGDMLVKPLAKGTLRIFEEQIDAMDFLSERIST